MASIQHTLQQLTDESSDRDTRVGQGKGAGQKKAKEVEDLYLQIYMTLSTPLCIQRNG